MNMLLRQEDTTSTGYKVQIYELDKGWLIMLYAEPIIMKYSMSKKTDAWGLYVYLRAIDGLVIEKA